jgi:hypothetical protein
MAESPNWASVGMRTPWKPDLATGSLLIRFGPPKVDNNAVLSKSQVLNVDLGEFRAAKRTAKSDQNQRVVSEPKEPFRSMGDDLPYI